MEAQTLNCPMCGASAPPAATRCEHCGARLAMVACPSCFGMIFKGARFCSHCGAKVDRQETDDDLMRPCPRCRTNTQAIVVGKTDLRECPHCEGVWADAAALQQVCTDREQQAAVLGMATTVTAPEFMPLEKVRYVPCPVCRKLMNRVNFARCSGVVVDVCKPHGTWFDREELRRIVEFIRVGGFERARANEMAELERERRELESARIAGSNDYRLSYNPPHYHPMESAVSAAAASILSSLFD